MNARISLVALALAASFLVATGCDRRDVPTSETNTTGAAVAGPALDNAAAVASVALARCDREATCNKLGEGRDHPTRESCLTEMRGKAEGDLNASKCSGGVDRKALDSCLAEIHAESCSNPLDTLERLAACNTSALCSRDRAPMKPPRY
ncbi:DUF6184 family natural product biosynthesis lipoprotein [Pendulispora brunnea]|uniref:DUF6184 family natural product biosynthesis lipoprotein n=1 Tax=Pendulispora brunnea TaxID=2905690 RepID=A0ABZ2KB46_9BACT